MTTNPRDQAVEAPKRKLIEVALPLETINRESAREKSIRHGHLSTLHIPELCAQRASRAEFPFS